METPDYHRDTYQNSARRFADFYLTLTQDHVLDYFVLDRESANLFRALAVYSNTGAWSDTAHLIQALGSFLDTRGYWFQHRIWLEKVIANWDGGGDPTTQIEVLENLADLTNSQGERDKARGLYERVIHLSEVSQDELHLARSYFGLGTVFFNLNQVGNTRVCWEKALSIAERIGDDVQASVVRYFLGTLSLQETSNEHSNLEMSLAIRLATRVASQLGDIGRHMLIQLQAMTHFARNEDEQANRLYLEALELAKKEGDQLGIALTLYQLGRIAHRTGDPTRALDYYVQSLQIAEPMDDRTGLTALYPAIGLVYLQQQRFDLARPYLERGVILERAVGDENDLADCLFWLGYALANTGDPEQARQVFEESLGLFNKIGSSRVHDVKDVLSRLQKVLEQEND